jgi:hypothetical protein
VHERTSALVAASGEPLVITPAAVAHLEAHPTVWAVLEEAVAQVKLPASGSTYAVEVDLGRPLERAGCVPVERIRLDTPATFARRANRAHPSRVVEGESTVWDSTVVIRAQRPQPGAPFELGTAYIGKLAPLEPWDPALTTQAAFDAALDFWSRHALVHDPRVMQSAFGSTWQAILRQAQSPFLPPTG